MKLSSIEKIINLAPIDGADKIEVATILGWKVVVNKGKFKEGDLVVFHYPDTVLPERPEYEFLRKENFRLKVKKFRKQISQGFVLSIDEMLAGIANGNTIAYSPKFFTEGLDITEMVGIKKYEKPIPACLAGKIEGSFPSFLKKTDELNLRSYPEALKEFTDKYCIITKKYDGSSATFFLKDEKFGVCSRNLQLKEDENNSFWKMARKYKIEEALRAFKAKYPKVGNCALQGEVYGLGIQGNPVCIPQLNFIAFNFYSIDHGKYANHDVFMEFCVDNNIPFVDIVWAGKFNLNLEDLINISNKTEYGDGVPCEGIVLRPVEETHSEVLDGRLSVKIISEVYALKHGE